MARPLRIQYPGAYYHVTCRGNERKKIFFDEEDRKIFLEKLSLSLDIYNVNLLAYICMLNHFHLLLRTPQGNLSEFMRHFNISYTSTFNKRHRRVGHLYQGRYKSFLIDADNYLLAVSRYIHLNPIRIKSLTNKTSKERWDILQKDPSNSLKGYLSKWKRKGFVNYRTVFDYIGGDNRKGRQAYREFILEGVERGVDNPLELGKGCGIVGENAFIEWIKEKYLSKTESRREQPALKKLRKSIRPEELMERFILLIGKPGEEICQRGRHSEERAMMMEVLYRFCDIKQAEIGKYAGGIDYSTVSQSRKRLQNKLLRDSKLSKRFNKICEQLAEMSN
jgi:REP element-mobilizing transposase RayT